MADYVMNKEGKYGYLFVQDMSGTPASRGSEEALTAYRKLGARQLWIDSTGICGVLQDLRQQTAVAGQQCGARRLHHDDVLVSPCLRVQAAEGA